MAERKLPAPPPDRRQPPSAEDVDDADRMDPASIGISEVGTSVPRPLHLEGQDMIVVALQDQGTSGHMEPYSIEPGRVTFGKVSCPDLSVVAG